MNEENNTKNMDTKNRSISPVMAVIIVIIIIILGFVVLKPADKADAPSDADEFAQEEVATTTEKVATTTEDSSDNDAGGMKIDAGAGATVKLGSKVIQGDGFTAVITPVENQGPTGPTPVVREFTFEKTSTGTCLYSWNVDEAEECSFVDPVSKNGTRDVGDEGNIQIVAGTYQIQCVGSGGMVGVSEVLTCE